MILSWPDYDRQRQFTADVVVVGTGAGGAAAGAALAEAGLDVVFVEEGGWHATSSFNPYMAQSSRRLYRGGGATMIFGRTPFPYVEGRCVGGSTVINGGMCYRAPDDVLASWERDLGSPDLGERAMAPLFEEVEARISARPQIDASVGGDNRIMSEAARRKGWEHTKNERNQHLCVGANNCILGCPTGGKQSSLVTWMPDAMTAGARCLTHVRVESLRIEGGRCAGIKGRAIDPRTNRPSLPVEVKAKAVVVACGAVQTPTLLLRHRIGRPSGQLGRNFLVHPNVKVLAVYPYPVNGWQGVSQWGQVRQFHDQGIIFAENMTPAAVIGAALPRHGAASWEVGRRFNHMVLSGVLVEDSNSGRVRRGPFGMALPFYDITDHDHERFVNATRWLAEMHFSMGAEAVHLPFAGLHLARSPDELHKVDAKKIRPQDLEMFTPHLMGTARMGTDRRRSVVDLDGAIWDLPGCYVADASVFPTAIGVNPQVTIMALARRIGRRLSERLLEGSASAATR